MAPAAAVAMPESKESLSKAAAEAIGEVVCAKKKKKDAAWTGSSADCAPTGLEQSPVEVLPIMAEFSNQRGKGQHLAPATRGSQQRNWLWFTSKKGK